jgi:hypothetical protein
MTMLMHIRGPFGRDPSSARRARSGIVRRKRLAIIKRICISVLTVLAAGGAISAIIALKAAIYYWRFLH